MAVLRFLESTTNLQPPIAWTGVTNAVVEQDGRRTVTLPAAAAQHYFRLHR